MKDKFPKAYDFMKECKNMVALTLACFEPLVEKLNLFQRRFIRRPVRKGVSTIERWIDGANTRSLSKLALVSFVLALSIFVLAVVIKVFVAGKPFEHLGPFGDFIGGTLNPVLTFMMFMSVLVTIVIQSKELKDTRGEIKRQAKAHEEHLKAIKEEHKTNQLRLAFNESRDKFWELTKDKLVDDYSLYDLVMSGGGVPEGIQNARQDSILRRRVDNITALAIALLPRLPEEAAKMFLSDLEDTYEFATELNLITDENAQSYLSDLEECFGSKSGTKNASNLSSRILKSLAALFEGSAKGSRKGEVKKRDIHTSRKGGAEEPEAPRLG